MRPELKIGIAAGAVVIVGAVIWNMVGSRDAKKSEIPAVKPSDTNGASQVRLAGDQTSRTDPSKPAARAPGGTSGTGTPNSGVATPPVKPATPPTGSGSGTTGGTPSSGAPATGLPPRVEPPKPDASRPPAETIIPAPGGGTSTTGTPAPKVTEPAKPPQNTPTPTMPAKPAETGAGSLAKPPSSELALKPTDGSRSTPQGGTSGGATGGSVATPPKPATGTGGTTGSPPGGRSLGGSTPSTATPTATGSGESYQVKSGETLSSIAKEKLGAEKYWTAIQAANPGLDPNRLRVGQKLVIPSKESIEAAHTAAKATEAAKKTGNGGAASDASKSGTSGDGSKPGNGGATSKPAKTAKLTDSGADKKHEPAAAVATETYDVKNGDTLVSIAKKMLNDGGRWEEIYALNRDQLPSPDKVKPGMKLKVPAAKKP